MRYNLFWDNVPFLAMIFLEEAARGKGYGKRAVLQWDAETRSLGFPRVMTSTQADETARHFYRRLGYKDAGCLILNEPPLSRPAEIFFLKQL
ncbi:MAG: GNAT family N-acetyltransferase [Bacillota bacterium]